MSYHPANLAIRFLLELAALVALGMGGWALAPEGALRVVAAVAAPLVAATAWGVFAVPGDRSRSGKAPVPVSGVIRLALEACVFGAGTAGLVVSGHPGGATAFGLAVVAHYAVSGERVGWLVRTR